MFSSTDCDISILCPFFNFFASLERMGGYCGHRAETLWSEGNTSYLNGILFVLRLAQNWVSSLDTSLSIKEISCDFFSLLPVSNKGHNCNEPIGVTDACFKLKRLKNTSWKVNSDNDRDLGKSIASPVAGSLITLWTPRLWTGKNMFLVVWLSPSTHAPLTQELSVNKG